MTDPTIIDLSRLPSPDAVESLDIELIRAEILADFTTNYPQFSADLESEMVVALVESFAYREFLVRQRFNDNVRAVLAPYATGANLDAVAARLGLARKVLVPATGTEPAVMETDEQFRRRYLLAFDRPSAGSAGRYLFEAWTAWPDMLDARVNGHAVHGRRGETDVVIAGPGGRAPDAAELAAVRAAVTDDEVKPEAMGVSVLAATRREYDASLVIEVGRGPDPEAVRLEALARVQAAAAYRTTVGGEIPAGLLPGAAYGANVLKVRDLDPVALEPDPYGVPVMTGVQITVEVRP